jgi:hypothetical protein
LVNITNDPHAKSFPTITHKAMFHFWKYHFRRDEQFGAFLETHWKYTAWAQHITSARPFWFYLVSACDSKWNWALHVPIQAHAWRPFPSMHMHCSCIRPSFAINKCSMLHIYTT